MKRPTRIQPRRRGFTLLEVLLVLVILGVIAALVVPQLTGSQERAMIMAAKTKIKQVEATLERYAIEHDATYPETLEELVTPLDRDGNAMSPYEKEFPTDPWKQPLNFELVEADDGAGTIVPRIWSNGPNKKNDDGDGDDINNWSEYEESR